IERRSILGLSFCALRFGVANINRPELRLQLLQPRLRDLRRWIICDQQRGLPPIDFVPRQLRLRAFRKSHPVALRQGQKLPQRHRPQHVMVGTRNEVLRWQPLRQRRINSELRVPARLRHQQHHRFLRSPYVAAREFQHQIPRQRQRAPARHARMLRQIRLRHVRRAQKRVRAIRLARASETKNRRIERRRPALIIARLRGLNPVFLQSRGRGPRNLLHIRRWNFRCSRFGLPVRRRLRKHPLRQAHRRAQKRKQKDQWKDSRHWCCLNYTMLAVFLKRACLEPSRSAARRRRRPAASSCSRLVGCAALFAFLECGGSTPLCLGFPLFERSSRCPGITRSSAGQACFPLAWLADPTSTSVSACQSPGYSGSTDTAPLRGKSLARCAASARTCAANSRPSGCSGTKSPPAPKAYPRRSAPQTAPFLLRDSAPPCSPAASVRSANSECPTPARATPRFCRSAQSS